MMSPLHPRPHLAGQTEASLAEWARSTGATEGAARALARRLVARFAGREPAAGAGEPSRSLLAAAAGRFDESLPPAEAVVDPDGSVRFAVRFSDGEMVEAVAIHQPRGELRARERWTVCLSSQVGCARGCTFCATGRLGLRRNLDAAEIVAQYGLVARHLRTRGKAAPRNVVFMGMGEPLDNLDQVLRAIAVLREPAGFAVPERRITVSTVGIVPKMDELASRTRAGIAVSLHAISPEIRRAILPVARRWELAALRDAISRAGRTVLLQWTLIEGVNDSDRDADGLAQFARGLDVRVNLIPLNPGPEQMTAPSFDRCRAFQKRLLDRGVRALLRLPHGRTVGGACGQLAGSLRDQATVRKQAKAARAADSAARLP